MTRSVFGAAEAHAGVSRPLAPRWLARAQARGRPSLAQETELMLPSPARSSLPGLSLPAFTEHSQGRCVPASAVLLTPRVGHPRTTVHCVCVACCVPGKALFLLLQEDANPDSCSSPCHGRASGLGREQRPAQSHTAGEHSSWCVRLSSKARVRLRHLMAWLFYHIHSIHVYYLSGFAFQIAGCSRSDEFQITLTSQTVTYLLVPSSPFWLKMPFMGSLKPLLERSSY